MSTLGALNRKCTSFGCIASGAGAFAVPQLRPYMQWILLKVSRVLADLSRRYLETDEVALADEYFRSGFILVWGISTKYLESAE